MTYTNPVIQPNINTDLSQIERIERKRLTGTYELPDPSVPYTIRCAFYRRVSGGPQAEDEKASLPAQKKEQHRVKDQNKWSLFREYEDVKPTTYEEDPFERDGLAHALKDAEKGLYDVLVIWIDSRLGRNIEETRIIRKLFRERGVQIYSIKKPLPLIDPRFYVPKIDKFRMLQEGFNDLSSASESAEFSEKMMFGKMKVAYDGRMPSRVPFGYYKKKKIIIRNGKEKVVSEIYSDKEKLSVVKEIFDLYLNEGKGIRKICGILNRKKAISPRNGKWCYSTIRYTLKNPAYAGKVRWGWKLSEFRKSKQRLMKGHSGIVVDGKHEGIIDPNNFVEVQKKMEMRAKLGGRAVSSRGLLVGVMKCPKCGGNAYVTSAPSSYAYQMEKLGKPKDKFSKVHFYVCSTVSKYGNDACTRYIVSKGKVEKLIVNEIRNLANSVEAQKSFKETLKKLNNKDIKEKEAALKRDLAKIPQARDRYSKALGEYRVMTYEEYGKQMGELAEREVELKSQLEELEKEKKKFEIIKQKTTKAINIFKNFDKIWDSANFEVKKDLIRSIIKKVIYSKSKLKIEYQI